MSMKAGATGRPLFRVPIKIICSGRSTLRQAVQFGWLPGARYTNLRDIRGFPQVGMIDIDWKSYEFHRHLEAVKVTRPHLTVARDILNVSELDTVLEQARELSKWAKKVIIVPKDIRLGPRLTQLVPPEYLLGYSVPTRYGSTNISIKYFADRHVHLLGGRPDLQYRLAAKLNVYSLDGNRITLDAGFGDYFAGDSFKPHPAGGYYQCIRASLESIASLWSGISGGSTRMVFSPANPRNIKGIKKLVDRHRRELGFVLRPAIRASIDANHVWVAKYKNNIIGFVRFHHRRDGATKIYEICVEAAYRHSDVARRLIAIVKHQAKHVGQKILVLKCPEDLPANGFYDRLGFSNCGLENGKRRPLRLWEHQVSDCPILS